MSGLGPLAQFLERQRQHCELTQNELAELIGVSRRSYHTWLNDPSKMSAERIEQLATALRMSAENRAVLYDLAGRAMPPREVGALSGLSPAELKVQQAVTEGLLHPSLVGTTHWDVVVTNAAFRELFANVPKYGNAHPLRNTMRYILLNPAAKERLGGSEDALFGDWIMPSLATFSAALQRQPQDPRLLELEEEIKQRKALLSAYRDTPDWIRQNSDLHVNSAPRAFVHPERGATKVRLLTEAHQGYQTVQLFRSTFIFGLDD